MWQTRLVLTAALIAVFLAQPATEVFGQQPDPIIDQLDKRMDLFFDQVRSKSRTPMAYDELLSAGPLSKREDRKELEGQTEQIETLYGPYRSHESVYTKRVGSDLVFLKYLYKCERFPVLWHVTFYRTGVGTESSTDSSRAWQVVSIRFDTDMELLTLLLRDK